VEAWANYTCCAVWQTAPVLRCRSGLDLERRNAMGTDELVLSARYVFEARIKIGERIKIGPGQFGERAMVPILGGIVEGPELQGEVLPGADWQLKRPDGVRQIEARYAIRVSDGTLIQVHNCGIVVSAEAGTGADPYVRTSPSFDAPKDGPHAWLNKALFLGTLGLAARDQVHVRFYRVQ
jgi:hypothetical protein